MFSSEELKNKRRSICLECPKLKQVIIIGKTCGRFALPTDDTCGCIIESKIALEFTKCPQNKW